MNVIEGLRRIGVVVGLVGAVVGGGIGYQSLSQAWATHTRFDRLRALPVMRDVAGAIQVYQRDRYAKNCSAPGDKLAVGYDALGKQNPYGGLPRRSVDYDALAAKYGGTSQDAVTIIPDKIVAVPGIGNVYFPGSMSDEAITKAIQAHQKAATQPASQTDWSQYEVKPQKTRPPAEPVTITPDATAIPSGACVKPGGWTIEPPTENEPAGWTPVPEFQYGPAGGSTPVPPFLVGEIPSPSPGYVPGHPEQDIWVDVNVPGDIKAVTADKSNAISSIQLEAGEWVRRESGSALASGLLVPLLFPVIGFLVPWGAMRVIVWVVSGFSAPRPSP